MKTLEIETDLDGWHAVLPGAYVNPVVAFIGTVHFAMGSVFALGGLVGVLSSLVQGEVFHALFALPFAAVGSVFAVWPVVLLFRWLQQTRIEVSGRSVRLHRTFARRTRMRVDLELADCADASFAQGTVTMAGHRFPVAGPNDQLEQLVEWLQEGATVALADPDARPPVPSSLRTLRAEG